MTLCGTEYISEEEAHGSVDLLRRRWQNEQGVVDIRMYGLEVVRTLMPLVGR